MLWRGVVWWLQVSQPLVPLVDEFASRLFQELDYVQEGKNAERFQVGGGDMPWLVACLGLDGASLLISVKIVCWRQELVQQ